MYIEDQMLAGYVQVMGSHLGTRFFEIEQDVDWLKLKWSVFNDTFNKGAEQIVMLNKVGPNFFHILRRLLFEDAMLNLCRLTDPPKTFGRHENLTIMNLSDAISDPGLKAAVDMAASQARAQCDFARQWRDKRLAHTDLHVFRNGSVTLPNVDGNSIETATSSLSVTLNQIRIHYKLPPIAFLSSDPYGASSVMYYLQRGLEAVAKEDALPVRE